MCGLAGFLSVLPQADVLDSLHRMNRTLHHRGPDQDGTFVSESGKVALAHKRLSIIDLAHGRQPMTCPENRFTLVFNGEIYNHGELRRELIAKGHPIRSRSDTETLLFAFKEWGAEGCATRLRGMFAFAVHDKADGSVHLVRDRLGIKPMYYGTLPGRVLFASECKAILAHPGFPAELDPQAISDYFSLMYVPAPKTAFKAIRKLPAGHWLRIAADGALKLGRYWDLEFADRSEYGSAKDMARGAEDILAALEDAVKSHMESDVPMGAFLSGGVDSAAVVAMMARGSASPILTNTVGFKDRSYDESAFARDTAAHFRTEHREHVVEPDALGILRKLSWHFDEPFADSSMIPTFYVCEMARKSVTVALSGDGGDESFAGYRRYKYDLVENRLRGLLPAAVRAPLFGLLGAAYPKADWLPQPLRAKTLLNNLALSPVEGYFTSMSHFLPAMKARLFSGDFRASLGGYDSLSVFEEHWKNCASRDPLSRVQYLDFKTYLVDDILTKVDRTSMAVSLEVRVPLLDHRFVELAARMPSGWKLRGGEGKAVFKDSLRKVLPAEIFARRKTGFAAPIKEWFRRDLAGGGPAGPLEEAGLFATGLFDRKYVEGLWREHRSGLRDHTFPLFALLSFAYWHERFLVRNAGDPG
jgi:asparagine synthase (glutamine-hydrolysing)